jgi:hypothetical protein
VHALVLPIGENAFQRRRPPQKPRNYRELSTLTNQFDSQRKHAMPALLWIAFWSNLMGVAMGWQETVLPIRVRVNDRRDRSAQ